MCASPMASWARPAVVLGLGVPGQGLGGDRSWERKGLGRSFPAACAGFCRTPDMQLPCVESCPEFAGRGAHKLEVEASSWGVSQ